MAQMLCTMIFARSALKVEMYLGRDLKKKLFAVSYTHLSLPGRGAQGGFHPPAQAAQLVKARGHGEESPRRQNPP